MAIACAYVAILLLVGIMSIYQDTQQLLRKTNTRLADETFHIQLRAQRKNFDDNVTRYTVQQIHFDKDNNNETQRGEKSSNQPAGIIEKLPTCEEEESGDKAGKRILAAPEQEEKMPNTDKETMAPITPQKKLKAKHA